MKMARAMLSAPDHTSLLPSATLPSSMSFCPWAIRPGNWLPTDGDGRKSSSYGVFGRINGRREGESEGV